MLLIFIQEQHDEEEKYCEGRENVSEEVNIEEYQLLGFGKSDSELLVNVRVAIKKDVQLGTGDDEG